MRRRDFEVGLTNEDYQEAGALLSVLRREMDQGDYFYVPEECVLPQGWHYMCPGPCFQDRPRLLRLSVNPKLVKDENDVLTVDSPIEHNIDCCGILWNWDQDRIRRVA